MLASAHAPRVRRNGERPHDREGAGRRLSPHSKESRPVDARAEAGAAAGARRLSIADQLFLSCFWFAYNVQWGGMLAVVLPSQIAAIVGDQRKEVFAGLILPLGAALSLVLTPVAGALSDRSRNRFGRRRPLMVVGTAINVLFLLALSRFGPGSPVGSFVLAYLGVQLGSNIAGGPYAALIPDMAPPAQRGSASGWLALMTAIGTLTGALAAGQLIHGQRYGGIYLLIVSSLLVMLVLTVMGVRERPLTTDPGRFELGGFLRSFVLDPKVYRDFYWVLGTRALVAMGIYSVFTFFQYFLKDVIRVPNPEQQTSFLIGIIIATGIPTGLLGGHLSDRFGRKPIVYASGGLMALASIVFIADGLWPSIGFTYAVGALFGLGYGAYLAVDWALAVDTLPGGENAAKDMGIWHVALVLPQIFAPAVTGLTLNALKPTSLMLGYTVVFIMTALWFVLGTVFVRKIRGVA